MNILENLIPLIREFESTNPDVPITLDRTFESFGFDSLDTVMLTMEVEGEFEVMLSDADLEKCKTVGDLVALVEKELEK